MRRWLVDQGIFSAAAWRCDKVIAHIERLIRIRDEAGKSPRISRRRNIMFLIPDPLNAYEATLLDSRKLALGRPGTCASILPPSLPQCARFCGYCVCIIAA